MSYIGTLRWFRIHIAKFRQVPDPVPPLDLSLQWLSFLLPSPYTPKLIINSIVNSIIIIIIIIRIRIIRRIVNTQTLGYFESPILANIMSDEGRRPNPWKSFIIPYFSVKMFRRSKREELGRSLSN